MFRRWLAVMLAFWVLVPAAWAAPTVGGDWTGVWAADGLAAAPVTMTITQQVDQGDDATVEGYFDWLCTDPSLVCSGREFFRGTVYGTLEFELNGIELVNAVNLTLGSYWGDVTADGIALTGYGSMLGMREPLGTLQLSRTVPEPATLALLLLALAAAAPTRRRVARQR